MELSDEAMIFICCETATKLLRRSVNGFWEQQRYRSEPRSKIDSKIEQRGHEWASLSYQII